MTITEDTQNSPARILVIGAGGNTGGLVVRQLLARGYKVRVLSRPQTDLTFLQQGTELQNQDIVHLDLRLADVVALAAALNDCTAVISTTGVKPPFLPGDIAAVETEGLKKLVEASVKAGVAHFVLTSSIGTEHPQEFPFLTQVLIAKRAGELSLIESGLAYTIVRPGGLTNEAGGQRLLVGRGDTIRGRVSRADVATVLIEASVQPMAANQVIEIIAATEAGKLPTDQQFFA